MPSDNHFSWRFVAPLYMGSTLNPINSSMIATALVPIAAYMQVSVALIRTFGYIGSIASSALIGIVFHTKVSDSGLHHIALIMIAVSLIALFMTIADHRLGVTGKQANAAS